MPGSVVDAGNSGFTSLFFKKRQFGDFPDGPVAKTLISQCRGAGFDPWSGN